MNTALQQLADLVTGLPSRGLDPVRLRHEIDQFKEAFRNLTLRQFPGGPSGEWSSWGVHFSFCGLLVEGRFAREHPFRPPRFALSPAPQNRHYYDDGRGPHLCYTRPEEWSPRYTMATAVAIVLRFITEYRKGEAR